MRRVALYLNPFDPPTVHHRRVAELLCKEFDRVVVVPSYQRRLIAQIPDSRPIHRATMTDLNFRGLEQVSVDLTDLEHAQFTPPAMLARRIAEEEEEVWHVVSADWIRGGGKGQSVIQREWSEGEQLWKKAGFAI